MWFHRLCTHMPTVRESVCCIEIPRVDEKKMSFNKDLCCITEHPGFASVCLDVYVLETAYYQYRSQYGELRTTIEEQVISFIAISSHFCENHILYRYIFKQIAINSKTTYGCEIIQGCKTVITTSFSKDKFTVELNSSVDMLDFLN